MLCQCFLRQGNSDDFRMSNAHPRREHKINAGGNQLTAVSFKDRRSERPAGFVFDIPPG